ncbi:hypothetical protein LINPERHAP2_LOCUS10559 [Linum perenne]
MRWIGNTGHAPVIFEIDAETVGKAITDAEDDVSEFGCLIQSCRDMLRTHPSFCVQVVRRNRNQVAHSLARLSFSFESPFLGTSPPFGLNDVLNDICFTSGH